MSTIGTKIRKIRELKNLKQEHMADKLGISTVTYGKIERDEADVSHERLEQIAKVFDISVQDILGFDEKQVLNFISNNHSAVGPNSIYNNFPEEMKKLYEDKIKLLEDKVEYLSREVERLNKR
jgi:transcriptional regulator with XRE-family HTH domain